MAVTSLSVSLHAAKRNIVRKLRINPLPVQFKSLLLGQEGCDF
jgi:hypothetical protein